MLSNVLCVGAGFSGAVIARELAIIGIKVTIIDKNNHVAGNCHSKIDEQTGIMEHVYGPHIFHTNETRVWNYINKFATMMPFVNRVKAISNGTVYSLPINLHTINQFFHTTYSPREAKKFIESESDKTIINPMNFEEQALKFVGEKLYKAFFYGYTKKQWGVDPKELPASILKRLPVRFNYDDNYFNHCYQGIPKEGYTDLVNKILDHPNIVVKLNTKFDNSFKDNFEHIFWSGPIDAWFNFEDGHLGYRTLDFEKYYDDGDFQGNAVINYTDENIPYTRISEHKYFSPWEKYDKTIYFKEYSRQCTSKDTPYYPIRLVNDKKLLSHYVKKANSTKNVTFIGRLGTYRYLDMDVTIKEALESIDKIKKQIANNNISLNPFYIDME